VDGITGQPAPHHRPGGGDRPAALGGLAGHLGGHGLLAIILYLCGVAVLYGFTATQATWGHPLWWPVVVGCAELAVISALGFAAGTFFPSRFTPPLAAVAAFFLSLEGFRNAVGRGSIYALLSPTTAVPGDDIGCSTTTCPTWPSCS